MNFKTFVENYKAQQYWYHGSSYWFSEFTNDFVGKGLDQYGIGIYFASTKEASEYYARVKNSFIYTVKLNSDAKILHGNQRLSYKDISKLVSSSSSLKERLMDWDENPNIAFKQALKTLMSHSIVSEVLPAIANDFFNSSIEFTEKLTKIICDGFVVDDKNNSQFLILNNPKAVQIVEIEKINVT